MNWLFDSLEMGLPKLNEPLVDCNNCQLKSPLKRVGDYTVDTKCCEFSPYWSSFAAGAWLNNGNSLKSLPGIMSGEMILTSIGILHPVEHRLGKENLCLHFNKEAKNCSVWAHRPPTCFTFFCASERKKGIEQYSMLEDWMLSIESAAIQAYFRKQGLATMDVWHKWVEYMEPEPGPFPEELLVTDIDQAEAIYKESHLWFKESDDCRVLRSEVKASWQQRYSFFFPS